MMAQGLLKRMIKLESDRLLIRHYLESDLDNLHTLISDEDNMRLVDDIFSNSIEETAQSLTHVMKNEDGQYFVICVKDNFEFIGGVGYTYTDIEQAKGIKIAHLGYFILPQYHGKGYVTEAVKRVLKFAFEGDGCSRITTGCHSKHVASERVMIKAGFCKMSECAEDRLEYALDVDDFNNNI